MRNKIILSTICCLFFFTVHPGHAADSDKILVSAGSATLTQADFNRIIADMPPRLKKMVTEQPELKTEILQKWADFSILAQEAEASGLGDKETAQRKIKEIRDRIMVQALIENQMAKTTVTDQEVSDYYNSHKNSYFFPEQVKAQHILIHIKDFENAKAVERAKEKIKTLQAKLAAGDSFATLAQQCSDDTVSKVKGGDVGFFPKGEMVPAFEEFAFNGAIGDISEPVKTKYGFHLIKITDKIKAGFSTLAKETATIRMQLTEEKNRLRVEALLADLKKKYKIKIYE